MLIIVCGLPGSGKTTFSRALARHFSAVHINSDKIRKTLFDKPLYSEDEKKKVYATMTKEAENALKNGKNVIVDATFYRKEYRNIIAEVAKRTNSEIYYVMCELDEAKIKERLTKRKKGLSDADFRVYLDMKDSFEPLDEKHLRLDCSLGKMEMIKRVEEFVGVLR